VNAKTDDNGMVTFEGFLGEYDFVCGDNKGSIELEKEAETVRMVL
jgi:endo-1,4-beta-xylanase